MKASANIFPLVEFAEAAAPATPASGQVRIYAKANGLMYSKDDAGTETALGGSSVSRNVVTALSSTAGVVTVDVSLGDFFTLTPTEAVTGWTFTNELPGYSINIVMTQGATPFTVAMPSGLRWAGGTAGTFSTAATKQDELNISSTDTGTTRRAVLAKDFS